MNSAIFLLELLIPVSRIPIWVRPDPYQFPESRSIWVVPRYWLRIRVLFVFSHRTYLINTECKDILIAGHLIRHKDTEKKYSILFKKLKLRRIWIQIRVIKKRTQIRGSEYVPPKMSWIRNTGLSSASRFCRSPNSLEGTISRDFKNYLRV